ncbi:conjugal transfer protein TrbH [Rhizobium sp. C4]|uniref:conjugal transfer protein TrbH n=1 Tax=Rhizobium sp. C4 TaxID=1349800 RepID=UPI001E41E9FA|nr:conjugal transfer protein TrbH [Rhizobium sp. C4]MCD2175092.1 conjugal transfer protein TrbH [Rhizobium sp. C4]
MRSLTFLLGIALVLSGCQTAEDGLANTPTTTASGPAASAIAGDLSSRLAEQVPPAATTLRLKSDRSEFAIALEAALKGWGYSVITDPAAKADKAVELAYSIQGADGQLMAQVSTPSIALGRVYLASATGATPASPLSIMHKN